MCDTFVVVDTDRVIFAKNSDRDPNEAQVLNWVAARDHPPGARLRCTWHTLPQVRHTHALILSRPYWMWGAEMGANEHGVVIGNEAVFTRAAFAPEGLLGMDIVRLALERTASATEAVELVCELVQTHGQGGRCAYGNPGFRYHNSFLVADRHQAWVIETAGQRVATERVTRGVRAISNGLTIPGLSRYSRPLRTLIAASRSRRARVECLAREVHSTSTAAGVLADHGPRPAPRFSIVNGAMQAPASMRED
ncbi:MAG: C69 family dipeptidase [Gammaproteobacteria bacterium]|nr:C69 family dipeptidase [Gammaproteobacteria bacterium]